MTPYLFNYQILTFNSLLLWKINILNISANVLRCLLSIAEFAAILLPKYGFMGLNASYGRIVIPQNTSGVNV